MGFIRFAITCDFNEEVSQFRPNLTYVKHCLHMREKFPNTLLLFFYFISGPAQTESMMKLKAMSPIIFSDARKHALGGLPKCTKKIVKIHLHAHVPFMLNIMCGIPYYAESDRNCLDLSLATVFPFPFPPPPSSSFSSFPCCTLFILLFRHSPPPPSNQPIQHEKNR